MAFLIKATVLTVIILIGIHYALIYIQKYKKKFMLISGGILFITILILDIYYSNQDELEELDEVYDTGYINYEIKIDQQDLRDYVLNNTNRKPEVNYSVVSAIDTALYEIIAVYRDVLNNSSYKPLITSANDYNYHMNNSAHYRGEAIDLRIKDLNSRQKKEIISGIKHTLGRRFLVLHEDVGQANEHIHVQLRS